MSSRKFAPQDLTVHIASTDTSPRASVALYDGQEETPTMDDSYVPTRPLSVAIPTEFGAVGSYCPRRPGLSEILANESPPPWTLSAFMAYLSQNHCLETLEFTMDASRYGKHYAKMVSRVPGGALISGSEEAEYLKMLWSRLMEAYIAPNGPREVNLPSEVRNGLLNLINNLEGLPPPPIALDNAVQHIYALMEESVLVPFLNSYYPSSAHPDTETNSSDENLSGQSSTRHMHSQSSSAHPFASQSLEERGFYRRSKRRSSPNQPHMSQSYSPSATNRASAPSTFSQLARGLSMRNAGYPISSSASPFADSKSPSPASAADSEMFPLTEDVSAATSFTHNSPASQNSVPAALNGDVSMAGLHTPPTTPPMSDCHPYEGSPLSAVASPTDVSSPREGTWRRMGRSLGLRRGGRRGGSGSPDGMMEEDG